MKERSSVIIPVFLAGAIVIASVIRFFQYVTIFDPLTGFFTFNSGFAGLLIYIVLIAAGIIYTVLCFLQKKKGDAAFFVSPDGTDEFVPTLMGMGFIAGGIIMGFGFSFDEISFLLVMKVCLSLTMVIAGAITVGKKGFTKASGMLVYIAGIVCFFTAAGYYNEDYIIVNHSDKLISVVALLLMSLFLISSARFFSLTEKEVNRPREIIYGGLVSMLACVYVLSKLLAMLFGGTATQGMDGIEPLTAGSGAAALCFVMALFFTKKKKDIIYLVNEDIYDEYMESKNKEKKNTEG